MNPVALFVYKRPDHTRRTLEALRSNRGLGDRPIYIFSDGAKRPEDEAAVLAVRDTCRSFKLPNSTIFESEKNRGLARSIISGVSWTLERHETVIVLEDDLVTSPAFISYMDQGLRKYAEDERVASIHGYTYPASGLPALYFLRGADCWGWATWRRAWNFFEHDSQALLKKLVQTGLKAKFDFYGAYPYSKMLEAQAAGRNDSWAIRWHASAFLKNMLTLYPGESLVENIGLDGSGTHSGNDDRWRSSLSATLPEAWPEKTAESREAFSKVREFLLRQLPWRRRLLARIKYVFDRRA